MGTMPHISKRFVKVKFWLSCNALVIEKAHQESRPNSIPKAQSTTLVIKLDLVTNQRYHGMPCVQIVRYVPCSNSRAIAYDPINMPASSGRESAKTRKGGLSSILFRSLFDDARGALRSGSRFLVQRLRFSDPP